MLSREVLLNIYVARLSWNIAKIEKYLKLLGSSVVRILETGCEKKIWSKNPSNFEYLTTCKGANATRLLHLKLIGILNYNI